MGYKGGQCCWTAEHAESSTFLVASQSSWDLSWTQKSGSTWERHREGGGVGGRAWARVQSTVGGGMWVGGRRALLVGGSLQGSMSPTHQVQLLGELCTTLMPLGLLMTAGKCSWAPACGQIQATGHLQQQHPEAQDSPLLSGVPFCPHQRGPGQGGRDTGHRGYLCLQPRFAFLQGRRRWGVKAALFKT